MPHRYPETHLLYRNLSQSFPVIVQARGCWLFDDEGKSYLDGCGGAFVASLGHGVDEVVEEIARQTREVGYVSGFAVTNPAAETLADLLAEVTLGDLEHFFFLSSGSDAVEAAVKLARQYWVELGRSSKHRVIALAPAYHGNTLLALSLGARRHYQTFFEPWLLDVVRVPAPCQYRCPCRGEEDDCPRCSGAALEEAILQAGPENVAAFVAEPVGGSSTGAAVPRPDYWKRVREICTRHEVLWIADEILVGAGRTGTWSALEPYGAVPDLQVMGKGLSGGYAPLAAVAVPRRIGDAIAAGSAAVLHAQTFVHAPAICAAGIAAIRYLRRHDLVARSREMGGVLHRKLAALKESPAVGDVRGRGLLAGVELVADRASRAPFPREARFAERLTGAARRAGLLVWPNTGHADGTNGDLVMLAPPFGITEAEIDQLVEKLGAALESLS